MTRSILFVFVALSASILQATVITDGQRTAEIHHGQFRWLSVPLVATGVEPWVIEEFGKIIQCGTSTSPGFFGHTLSTTEHRFLMIQDVSYTLSTPWMDMVPSGPGHWTVSWSNPWGIYTPGIVHLVRKTLDLNTDDWVAQNVMDTELPEVAWASDNLVTWISTVDGSIFTIGGAQTWLRSYPTPDWQECGIQATGPTPQETITWITDSSYWRTPEPSTLMLVFLLFLLLGDKRWMK